MVSRCWTSARSSGVWMTNLNQAFCFLAKWWRTAGVILSFSGLPLLESFAEMFHWCMAWSISGVGSWVPLVSTSNL